MTDGSGSEQSRAGGKCPVDHTQAAAAPSRVSKAPHGAECPVVDHQDSRRGPSFAQSLFGFKQTDNGSSNSSSNNAPSGCPVDHRNGQINPLNMMPHLPQEQYAGQKAELSTDRELSSIPRDTGAAASTTAEAEDQKVWEYPSSQQFYNALARKNMAAPEEYIDVMVDIHNFLNEGAWNEVLKWEARHKAECSMPRLSRLQGRPRDLSPMARISGWIHGVRPFDRHDWYVDRCGKQVRYVIDYYEGLPENGMPAFNLVVRPAIDDLGSLVDRAKQLWADSKEKYFGSSDSASS